MLDGFSCGAVRGLQSRRTHVRVQTGADPFLPDSLEKLIASGSNTETQLSQSLEPGWT